MNTRLLTYLRSLGLDQNATDEQAWDFYNGLRGLQASIASALNYNEQDQAARTNCDLMIRALGHDPTNPSNLLPKDGRRSEEKDDEEREWEDEDEEREDDSEDTEEREDDEETEERSRRKKRSKRKLTARQLEARGRRLEQERQSRIREMATNGQGGEIVPRQLLDQAINEGWSASRASQRFLQSVRDSRSEPLGFDVPGGAPAQHSRNSQTDFNRDALTAAMMLRGGVSDPVRQRINYNDRTGAMRFSDASQDGVYCRAVDRGYELRALSMVEVARRMLEQGGVRVDPIPGQITRAFETRATAATVQAYVGIYTQVFGALLLETYMQTADSTAAWTIERENPNFLQNERHRITKGRNLTKHHKGGEADDFGLEDTTEYTRVFRYSGKTAIDEMDLINDTMFNAQKGATPQEMGESARRLRPDLVYAILLSNPNLADNGALFSTSAGNLLYSQPMGLAAIQAGATVIRTRQENGVNLDLEAKYVITPHAISYTARESIRSTTVVVTGDTDTVRGSYNAVTEDGLQIVSDSRLDNGVTDPNSGTAYAGSDEDFYMAAPANRHTIEVTHLRGSGRVPEVRSGMFPPGFGQWGISFDVKHDLGAKAIGRAGLVKLVTDEEPT